MLDGVRYARAMDYDGQSRRTRLRVVNPWADTVRYVWNAYSQLDTLEDWGGGRTAFVNYNADRLPTAIGLPNGVTVRHDYVDFHTAMVDSFSTATVHAAVGRKYAFDTLGLVSDHVKAAGDSGRDFRYDQLDRLQRAANYTMKPGQCRQTWEEPSGYLCDPAFKSYRDSTVFSYDQVGNRTDLNAQLAPGNRLVKFNGDSLVYDADGNLTTRIRAGAPIQRLHWNSLGQLVAVWTSGADSVSFGYDGGGRRVRKWTATLTTRYLYDGDDLLAELDGPGNRVAEYTYYPGIDRPQSVRRGGQMYYYAQDFPGNVVGLVNSSGTVTNQYRYTPWGATELTQEGVANSLRFGGRQYDSETGLYYNRARYYDPAVGRFLSEDPLGLAAGINLYAFAGNDPVNGRDPSGMCANKIFIDGHDAGCSGGTVGAIDTWLHQNFGMSLEEAFSASGDHRYVIGGDALPTYIPKSGDVVKLETYGREFLDDYGRFNAVAKFMVDDIWHVEKRRGALFPEFSAWGPTFFKLDIDLDPAQMLSNPDIAWYHGKMKASQRWYDVSAKAYTSGILYIYVSTLVL